MLDPFNTTFSDTEHLYKRHRISFTDVHQQGKDLFISVQIPEEFVAVVQLLCCPGGTPPKIITAWPIARLKSRLGQRILTEINDCLYTKRQINAAFGSFLTYPKDICYLFDKRAFPLVKHISLFSFCPSQQAASYSNFLSHSLKLSFKQLEDKIIADQQLMSSFNDKLLYKAIKKRRDIHLNTVTLLDVSDTDSDNNDDNFRQNLGQTLTREESEDTLREALRLVTNAGYGLMAPASDSTLVNLATTPSPSGQPPASSSLAPSGQPLPSSSPAPPRASSHSPPSSGPPPAPSHSPPPSCPPPASSHPPAATSTTTTTTIKADVHPAPAPSQGRPISQQEMLLMTSSMPLAASTPATTTTKPTTATLTTTTSTTTTTGLTSSISVPDSSSKSPHTPLQSR